MRLDLGRARLRQVYDEYPPQFWTLVGATFVDHLGGSLLFPFFSLYITQKFGVGMTHVGLVFGAFAVMSLVGGILGGALTDYLGRKKMLIFGLVVSALSMLVLGVVGRFEVFFGLSVVVGLLSSTGGPAQQAMVADLLPEEKRAQGFGIIRVAFNLAVVIGPAIGGLLASRSYMLLFVCDAVASLTTASIVALTMRETRPERPAGQPQPGMAQALAGYRDVARDRTYLLFILCCMVMTVVYIQMNTSLGVYLRDVHGVPTQGYGYILSLNAAMVVLLQFPITRRISRYRPMLMMASGALLYALGFAMYGFVEAYAMFMAAMVIITIGEMLVAPVSQALVAGLAPEDMRGRYMAAFGLSWAVPWAVGPLLAGLVMDGFDPRWVWYAAGVLGLVATAGFLLLQGRVERRTGELVEPAALPVAEG